MAEQYGRVVVYHKWVEGDIFRPLVSFSSLKDAVNFVDEQRASSGPRAKREMKVIDLEHIDMGDMMVHPDCRELIDRIRADLAMPAAPNLAVPRQSVPGRAWPNLETER